MLVWHTMHSHAAIKKQRYKQRTNNKNVPFWYWNAVPDIPQHPRALQRQNSCLPFSVDAGACSTWSLLPFCAWTGDVDTASSRRFARWHWISKYPSHCPIWPAWQPCCCCYLHHHHRPCYFPTIHRGDRVWANNQQALIWAIEDRWRSRACKIIFQTFTSLNPLVLRPSTMPLRLLRSILSTRFWTFWRCSLVYPFSVNMLGVSETRETRERNVVRYRVKSHNNRRCINIHNHSTHCCTFHA